MHGLFSQILCQAGLPQLLIQLLGLCSISLYSKLNADLPHLNPITMAATSMCTYTFGIVSKQSVHLPLMLD